MAHAVAEAVVAELQRGGVDTIFGLPGGGPNLDKVGAAVRAGMRFVLAHGETSACIMASTYGLLTGPPGVCVVTRGPGVAAATNGVAQATLDRAPLLLISDRVPADQAARIAHQRFGQNDLMRPVTKWSGTVGRDRPQRVVAAALGLARRPPAGAVHLDYDPSVAGDDAPAEREPPSGVDPGAQEAAMRLVRKARRPLVIAGNGAVPAAEAVRALVRSGGLPALTTYQAKGVIPDSWPNAGGLFTNGIVERPLVEAADLIVTIGLDHVEPLPGEWTYDAPVVAVDAWESADRYIEPTVRIVGDIDVALARITEEVKSEWEPDAGVRARSSALDALAVEFPGFSPFDVVSVAASSCPDGATVTVDAGAHFLFVMPMWTVDAPRDLLISNGLATMGFALPAAIGAALARPKRPVLCLVGDGGLGMTLAELETVSRLALPVTTIVFNDAALSLIEIKQKPDQGGAAAVKYGAVDFAAVAAGFGIESSVATSRRDLERALAGSWRRPRLIDARIDPAAYRHAIAVTRG